jgi:peptidoglycan/LPS O-acetylase OafA/YrhL
MTVHLSPTNASPFISYIVKTGAGWFGVDLFFVLSGYLITGLLLDSAGRPGYYRNFVARRTLRIFPLYFACLILACVVDFGPWPIRWKDFSGFGGWWYPAFLGNIPVFLQNRWPSGGMTPLWSLQIEEQFYLTFPFLVATLPRKTLTRLLLASIVAAPLLRTGMLFLMPANITGTYVLMPCRMDALAMGGLIAIAWRDFPEYLRGRSGGAPCGPLVSARRTLHLPESLLWSQHNGNGSCCGSADCGRWSGSGPFHMVSICSTRRLRNSSAGLRRRCIFPRAA